MTYRNTGKIGRRPFLPVLTLLALLSPWTAFAQTPSLPAVTISGPGSIEEPLITRLTQTSGSGNTGEIHILAFNDLHGNLDPGALNIYGRFAGGAAYLAKAIKNRQARYGNRSVTVFAGDNIGASPLPNSVFFEEPITTVANVLGVDFASVGNHEFDKGYKELLRIQKGGCHQPEGCKGGPYPLPNGRTTMKFPGASFKYLAANVVYSSSGKPIFPAYGVKTFKNPVSGKSFKIGFIGEVLKTTPNLVTPTGVDGLSFKDEADTANAVIRNNQNKNVKIGRAHV